MNYFQVPEAGRGDPLFWGQNMHKQLAAFSYLSMKGGPLSTITHWFRDPDPGLESRVEWTT